MSTQVTHYEVLEVQSSASEEEVRRAYRKQARAWHPDVNGGCRKAEERFKDVQAAWSVLKDPTKRAAYDRKLRTRVAAAARPNPQPAKPTPSQPVQPTAQPRARPQRPQPQGPEPHPFYAKRARREHPHHHGKQEGAAPRMPTAREGQAPPPRPATHFTPNNGGRAKDIIVTLPLKEMVGPTTLTVKVKGRRGTGQRTITSLHPNGFRDGERVMLRDQEGVNYLALVSTRRKKEWVVSGSAITIRRKMSSKKAAEGGSLLVMTPIGRRIRVQVPPGSNERTTIRIPGHGMPTGNRMQGDLFIRLEMMYPRRKRG